MHIFLSFENKTSLFSLSMTENHELENVLAFPAISFNVKAIE